MGGGASQEVHGDKQEVLCKLGKIYSGGNTNCSLRERGVMDQKRNDGIPSSLFTPPYLFFPPPPSFPLFSRQVSGFHWVAEGERDCETDWETSQNVGNEDHLTAAAAQQPSSS